jgi:hypothetical protein
VVENIKSFGSELDIEVFRDPLDVVVLKHGEVRLGYSRTGQDIPTGITFEVKTLQGKWWWAPYSRWLWVAILRPKGHVRCGGDGETLCLDVVVGVPGIG